MEVLGPLRSTKIGLDRGEGGGSLFAVTYKALEDLGSLLP